MRCLAQLLFTTALFFASVTGVSGGMQNPPPLRPLIDCSNEELLQRVPGLKGVKFDNSPGLLKGTLNLVGKALDTSMDSFVGRIGEGRNLRASLGKRRRGRRCEARGIPACDSVVHRPG